MKFIKYITLILSLLVMAGHDIVPHLHDDDHVMIEDFTESTHSSSDGLLDLQDALSHFRHNANENRFVYLNTVEENVGPQINVLYCLPSFNFSSHSLIWESQIKKQRFWEQVIISSSYISNTSSLRGPPSC